MRTVQDSDEEEDELIQGGNAAASSSASNEETQTGIAAHKAVVGPDELVPGEETPEPKEAEKLKGTKTLLMWLPAIFDVR